MKIEQIYTGCLAEAAYYIESNGEAAIIDPLRETKPYIEKAERNGAKIKYILETHFHADFVSGHLDLAKKTGATIVFGPTAAPAYDVHVAKDNEELKLGNITIKVLHTPGHTMESTTYLLIDENGKENGIFTGDTLFIGDVGRPDLVQKVKAEITPEILAGYLYDSLRNKIMTLPDDVVVYPGHGAGSACGKNMSKETTDTLGHQKKVNYALRADMTKKEFIKELTEGLVEPPQYFPYNVLMNLKGGIDSIDEVIERGKRPLKPKEFEAAWEGTEALVLDTRSKEEFVAEYIPGSIFIGLDDNFAPWAGTLITDLKQPILFISDEGREEEVVIRLSRVGYDNTIGYLDGGLNAWKKGGFETDSLREINASDFAEIYEAKNTEINLLDARRKSEYDSEHLLGAQNFPLDFVNQNMTELNREKTYYVHCAGGYRSVIMCSILKSRGFENLVNIQGGYKALSQTDLKKTKYVEPTTML
ncbi:MAG TPA: MBL fold metallo-hydrolase [Chitinophagaceae bacterium]|nr:MBL fold metallo-hydrolase [Chitinophagales bacterium]HRX93431.1 MBL fold metallo-hydrolase [Chitinophagaceae bacterium]